MRLRMIGNGYDWPVEDLHRWVAEGLTHAQIAELLGGINPKLVSKACKRYGVQSQRRGPRSGPGHPEWKGGVQIDKHGYRLVWVGPDDPMACMARKSGRNRRSHYGYVPEHRLVMARHLGRPLESKEVVHHKNNVNDDNRIENLELFASNAEHLRHELTGKCPKWSEDGRRRILAAHPKRKSIPSSQGQDVHENSQSVDHSTSKPDKDPHGLS